MAYLVSVVLALVTYSLAQDHGVKEPEKIRATFGAPVGEAPELPNVRALLRAARENPATNPQQFPPVGDFEGVCYEASDIRHSDKKAKETINPEDPFSEDSLRHLDHWVHGDIKDLFKTKRSVIRVSPDGTVTTQLRFVLVPGEGAGEEGKELYYSYLPKEKSWGRTDSQTYYSGPIMDLPEGTPMKMKGQVYSRYGKTKTGEDFIVSRYVRTGIATVRKGFGEYEDQLVRIEDFCILNRIK